MPVGSPAAWGSGVTTNGSRNFQRFVGTATAQSSVLTGGRWHTIRNDGTVVVNVAFGSGKGAGPVSTVANIGLQPGEEKHWVTQEDATNRVACFAASAGDVKLWDSEASA